MMNRILTGRSTRLMAAALCLASLTGCTTTADLSGFLGDFARQVFAAWLL